ncbi:hypothetical protein EOD42_24790 [Rhodovarius crocodyli]|uniref:Uncharacterized protein n=1 Tax=Rhodovarius crocodyli TaxID=1979269 RepID=A0A437LW47_9PROT|nr:hypothetical protein [Rhodovarius crocodyli]RVT89618.1 hypothetical protein EOD42_24790 [Rhodovarius crocodyli]
MSDSQDNSRFGRRLVVLRLAAVGGAAGVVPAYAQGPKSGWNAPPGAAPGGQSGLTDNDPNDPAGNGRGQGGRPGGVTDSDPNDPPGQGRGRGGGAPQGPTDSDPNDPPGQGRGRGGGAPQGPTDSDPNDPPGRRRGGGGRT